MERRDVIADRFELDCLIGRGTTGEVWKAWDRSSEKAVALKLIAATEEGGTARFLREGLLLSQLRHPGIVRYVAHGETAVGGIYLAMEWLDGEDLARALERGPLSTDKTIVLVRRVAEALSVAHSLGVVHRDVKPSNIFLPGGSVSAALVLDFGVARIRDFTGTWTRDGWTLGTPAYMAPEQVRGSRLIDGRADLFSLGCVAFEALTGQVPFGDAPVLEVLRRIQLGPTPSLQDRLPDVPSELVSIVMRMMAKDPDDRPTSAKEVRDRLGALTSSPDFGSSSAPNLAGGELSPLHSPRTARQPGNLVAERFELLQYAGSGGMGEVWRARDRSNRSTVALKILVSSSESDRARFLREAAVLSDLVHPGIVRYLAHGTMPSQELYLAMEWLDGEDLSTRLRQGPLTIEKTLTLIRAVADALAFLHARGVVHRDIKPSNLFLPDRSLERVKLLDFGVARAGDVSRTRTRTGAMIGTPGYMAPEQARGEKAVDARADIFGLGCVMFECLVGRRAFEAEHVMAVLAKILIDDAPKLSEHLADVPLDLDALVSRMLAKDPLERPHDAAELVTLLSTITDRETSSERASRRALTRSEQRVLCAVLVPFGQPVVESSDPPANSTIREIVERCGGRLECLADGSLLAVLAGMDVASDLAAKAAQCALAIRDLLPGLSISLTTGRGEVGAQLAGEAIDRASRLLLQEAVKPSIESPGNIVLDDVTAALLGARFDVCRKDNQLALRGELELDGMPRTLLGRPTTCVGREPELAALQAIFNACREESVARAILVTAPAGAGKSRLRKEFVSRLFRWWKRHRAGLSSVQIWTGRGDSMRASSAFGLIGQILRQACGINQGESLDSRRLKLRAAVSNYLSPADCLRVTEFLGELIDTPFPDDDSVQLRAARRDPVLMSDRVRGAWEDFIRGVCEAGPALLVLEDLHWGDVSTVKLIDSTLGNLRDRPITVLALARPEVHDVFPKLWANRELHEMRLGGLTTKASEQLAHEVLGASVPDEIVRRVVERADGNAFYLEELIRAVADRRDEVLPESVVAMVQARLEKLPSEARRVLRAASVFGQTFWRGGVAVLLGATSITDWLHFLDEQELVARQPTSRYQAEEEYVFRHALLRDGAYAMLTPDDRTLGHHLAGDWLERVGEGDATMMAEHFERAAAPDRALRWYPLAARQALEANDLEGALDRARRGLACGATGPDRGGLLVLQAEALNWLGENAESLRLSTESLALLTNGSAAWFHATREAIIVAGKMGKTSQVVEIAAMCRDHATEPMAESERRMALGWAAVFMLINGEHDRASQVVDELRRNASHEDTGDPRFEAVLFRCLGWAAVLRGRHAEAVSLFRASSKASETAGDNRSACSEKASVGFQLISLGAYESAEQVLNDALAEARRMGLLTIIPQLMENLGVALMGLGQLERATAVETEVAEAMRAQGDHRTEAAARSYVAKILLHQGKHHEAEEQARLASTIAQKGPGTRPMALAVLAQTLLAQERPVEAVALAREARDLLSSFGAIEDGDALVRLTFAEALHAVNDPQALEAICEARDEVLARAEAIEDATWRELFLERVGENAKTIALAASWGADQ
jgi:serine/threonine protein kinase/tetratricopeptide (TPR) repeat protein